MKQSWLYHASQVHKGMFKGKILSLVSPAVEGYAPCGIPFGSASGQFYRNMPGIVARIYSIPYEVFEIADYQAKYYAIMRISLEHDVHFIGTANPSSVLKMCQKASEFSEEIIKDIRDGTLSGSFKIEPEIRTAIERRLKPNPLQAKMLTEARARRDGVLKPGDYWPNMEIIGCWKGGTVGPYLDKFPGRFTPDGQTPIAVRDWGYISSEAQGSIPLSDEGSRGVLTVGANFMEFVPVDDVESNPGNPSVWNFLTVGDVVDEGRYYILFTTTGGLYRYDINDVVQIKGYYNKTPQIVFLRKGRGMTNITGEKISVNQIIDSCQYASKETHVVAAHFRAEAHPEASRYILRVEFDGEPDDETLHSFLRAFDTHLEETNIEYKSKRKSMRLGAPVLHVMREGWYEKGRRKWVSEGKRAFQAKTQILKPMKDATIEIAADLRAVIEIE